MTHSSPAPPLLPTMSRSDPDHGVSPAVAEAEIVYQQQLPDHHHHHHHHSRQPSGALSSPRGARTPSEPITPCGDCADPMSAGRPQPSRNASFAPPQTSSSNATLLGSTSRLCSMDGQGPQIGDTMLTSEADMSGLCLKELGSKPRRRYSCTHSPAALPAKSVATAATPISSDEKDSTPPPAHLSMHQRMRHFTWAWFTSCMSTGGIAILLHVVPHKFDGLEYVGRAFYVLQLTLFLGILSGLAYRFLSYPGTLPRSLQHHIESLFVPTVFIASATVLSNARIYGGAHCGPWLDDALRVCFWIYSAVTFVAAIAQYQFIFEHQVLSMPNMTPGWLLPVFAPMMAGTIAINIAAFQPRHHALPICVCGLVMQFLGFFMFLFLMSMWVGRLVMHSLPPVGARPGMFIAVGPPSFTAFVIIDLAKIATAKLAETGQDASWLNLFAVLVASSILILSVWFVALTLAGLLPHAKALQFKIGWWALVFPNIGFTIAVIAVAEAFECEWLKAVGTAMVIVMFGMWVFVALHHIAAVCTGRIMWPGKDEDA